MEFMQPDFDTRDQHIKQMVNNSQIAGFESSDYYQELHLISDQLTAWYQEYLRGYERGYNERSEGLS
jgi:hypothetical protein